MSEVDSIKIAELLEKHGVVKGSTKMPSRASITELANFVQALHQLHEARTGDWKIADEKLRRFRDAISEIDALLPDLISIWEHLGHSDVVDALNRVKHSHSAVKSFYVLFPTGRELNQLPVSRTADWHTYVQWLRSQFEHAMRSTNPGLDVRPSNDGPLTRFIAAVIPLITGENPKPPAIARQLQRMEKEARQG